MKKSLSAVVALGAMAVATAPASAALVVHTSPFIGSPTNFNGFEGLTQDTGFSGPYTEGGITVEHSDPNVTIWTVSQPSDGNRSWYPDGGGTGFTSIKLASGGDFNAIEFLAGSGWGGTAFLQYELLNDGLAVATGEAGNVPAFRDGFVTYGFSGLTFDEVRLQVQSSSAAFDPGAFEALAIDSIKIGNAIGAVPEPASWAFMIFGFGAIGSAMRRQRKATVKVSYS